MEKLLFKDIYAIQTLLFPDRWQMLQPTEIFLSPACQKNVFNTLTMEQPTTCWRSLHQTQELKSVWSKGLFSQHRSTNQHRFILCPDYCLCSSSSVAFTAAYPSLLPSAKRSEWKQVRKRWETQERNKKNMLNPQITLPKAQLP